MTAKHWDAEIEWLDPQRVDIPDALADLAAQQPFLARALVWRGFTTLEATNAFLDPAAYTPCDPFDLPDMEKAVSRLEQAIQSGEWVGVWGDFDVDGQTSTTILVDTLRALGANVTYHIPVRARESHGIGLPALGAFLDGGVKLVLTCDTGIGAHDAVQYARERAVDMLITDHHTLLPSLPPACAVVNPQRLPASHAMRTLSGAGVAYQLALALSVRAGRKEIAERQLDLTALGLVADLAELTGDARYLVQRGLAALRHTGRLGLRTLYETSAIDSTYLNEEHIGFLLAPRLNAIGRLDDANPVVTFFTTDDPVEARITAERLEGLNAQRKLLCDDVLRGALAQIEREPGLLEAAALVLSHPLWPAGVVGIVASRLVELFNRPVVLLCAPPGADARGSARSVEGVNIIAAISACQEYLTGFGGHPMAAGMALDPARIPDFRRALSDQVAAQLAEREISSAIQIDSWLTLDEINFGLADQIDRLAPFAPGNPAPVFATQNLRVFSSRLLGKEQEHRKLLVGDDNGRSQDVLWWGGGSLPEPGGMFDLAYQLRAANFRGSRQIELVWLHSRERQPETIKLQPVTRSWVDYRNHADPQADLLQLVQLQPDVLIWQEGEHPSPLPGVARSELRQAEQLVIWNAPPAQALLDSVLTQVQPRVVHLFGLLPGDAPTAFLRRLGGLVVFTINNLGGRTSLIRLAEATAQLEITVRTGLRLLAARGQLVILQDDQDGLWLDVAGQVNVRVLPEAAEIEKELLYLLKETQAFRAFYLRSQPEHYLNEV